MAVEKTQGILLGIAAAGGGIGELSPRAYGGYIFSAHYSINFTQPSKLTLAIVSEDGEYDEQALAERIFPGQGLAFVSNDQENENNPGGDLNSTDGQSVTPISTAGGAITYDEIQFGGQRFLMHPLKYSINEGPNGRYLQIDYYDRSIAYLDKVLVLLDKKHLPPTYNPQYPPFAGGLVVGRQPNIIQIGQGYYPASDNDSGVPGEPNTNEDSARIPTYLYSPNELYAGMLGCPALQGVIDMSCSALNDYARFYAGISSGNDNLLKGHVGTLRQVLDAWSRDLGFIFYWEPSRDTLGIMDLRSDLHFDRIQNTVGDGLSARNIIERTWSYSIDETFSKGISAYFGRDGKPGAKVSKVAFSPLDLLELNIHRCYTETELEKECEDIGGKGDIWNAANYCFSKLRRWDDVEMSDIRGEKDEFIDYIRLLKAAVIGPEFYKIYVLNKKLAGHRPRDIFPDWGGAGPNNPQPLPTEQEAVKKLNAPAPGQSAGGPGWWNGDKFKFGTPGAAGAEGVFDENRTNSIVDKLYYSDEREEFNQKLTCYTESDRAGGVFAIAEAAYIVGKDCISIELLDPNKIPKVAQVDQVYNFAAARLLNTSASTTEKSSGRPGPFVICRLKKYGIRPIITNPQDDHIFKLLNGIGLGQGRFSYSKNLETMKDFSRKKYTLDGVGWYDRALDVNDTPLGPLYNSINPTAGLAAVAMPNACIEYKNRESKEKDCEGEPFTNPENTARPTIEQFIQSVYADTVVDQREGAPATFNVTVVDGVVTDISVADAGEGYLDAGDGVLPGVVTGPPGSGASFDVEITDGKATSVTLNDGGTDYPENGTIASLPGNVNFGVDVNVFGEELETYGEENQDSILSANLSDRNQQCMKDCEKKTHVEDRKGVVMVDHGFSVKIPNTIQMRIERHVNSFSVIPTSNNISLVTYHDEAGYQMLAMATPADMAQLKDDDSEYSDWFKSREELATTAGSTKIVPADELDFIVDQVEVPNLDVYIDSAFKNKLTATSLVQGMGDKFETSAFVRPLYESNVRELTVDFLTPSEKDFGVKDADCQESTDPEELAKKRKKDDKLIQRNIANYAQAFAFQQDRVEFNAQITVADYRLQDESLNAINLLVQNGLESMNARVSEEGTKLTFAIGTRRKRRVIHKPFADMWMAVKPEFYNNIFDI